MFDWNDDAQREAFLEYLGIEMEDDWEPRQINISDLDMAFHYARTGGLDNIGEAMEEMQKHDLAQIGMVFLCLVMEASHSGWDGMEREEIEHYDYVLRDMVIELRDPHAGHYTDGGFTFNCDDSWDKEGKHYSRFKREDHQEEEQADG